ncbi:MAG: S41 family peptidase [Oscillospiraceae bacterium]|nr:S41 family peptidase [Oscillospiraceae bacterium]
MKKVLKFLSYVLVATVTSVATMGVMVLSGYSPDSKLDELENLINAQFIGEVDQTAIEDAAATAMVYALGDRWSYYIPASEYQSYTEQMKNAYVGIGVTITPAENGFEILKVEESGPAAEAGIQAGDIIVAIEGQSAAGMTSNEAGTLVKGEENTPVELTLRRGEEELTLSVTRKQVLTVVASCEMLEGNIGLITIANFDARCATETISAIMYLVEQGATALIFDVRNNPGGYKDELVQVLNYLLPEGPLFRSEDFMGRETVDESDESCLEIPMAVLVNRESYSAAEFFAAALNEYDAAVVVGEQTVGKGYFQVTTKLSDGSAVGLSIGKYYTPNGVSLADEGGLTPEIVVEVDDETFSAIYAGILEPADDPQIQAAIEALQAQ